MQHKAGQEHWYGPLVRAEHKIGSMIVDAEHKLEKAIDHDVEDTIRDLDQVEKKIERFERVHPRVWWWVEVLAYVGFLAILLAAHVSYNQDKMLP